MNELSREKKLLLLRCMCCGCGVRDCVEIADCDPGTVLRYLIWFGTALEALHNDLVRNLTVSRLEVDEVWSFVYGKTRNKRRFSKWAPEWAGDYFTWTALDPDSKLLVSYHISKRKWREALKFLFDVRSRTSGKILITTDAHPVYKRAISFVFGADADHVRIEKVLASLWNRETNDRHVVVVSMRKEAQNGAEIDLSRASTSRNERHNGTMRNFISRLQRYTYGFSKKLRQHECAHAIYAAYYNFRKRHRSLDDETPAMRAGITDKVWSFEDFLDWCEAFWLEKLHGSTKASPVMGSPAFRPMEAGISNPSAEFFVCLDIMKDTAKVHAGHCRNCRHGRGRGEGVSASTRWYDFHDRYSAEQAAAALAPEDHSVCSICIKRQYRTKFQPV